MKFNRRLLLGSALLAGCFFLAATSQKSLAYVEAPHSFGQVVQLSTNIIVLRVEKVDKEKKLIIYKKVEELKGKDPRDTFKHNVGTPGFNPRESKFSIDGIEPGRICVFFFQGNASETFTGKYWYETYAGGEWWTMSHGEPYLLRTYAGSTDKLIAAVKQVLAGRDAIVPCMVNGNLEDLHMRRARIQRLKVSLKLQNYDPKRDFVGWGGEDFRRVAGMPGFTHYSALSRVDPEALGVSAVDFDGDGKADLCLVGAGRIGLLQNSGESLNEVSLPGVSGARAAVWADYNGDGKPDLLLAASTGPKLYTNLGKGIFRDDSHLLPRETIGNVTAAAWMDHDGDGRPDILLATGFHGLHLYQNKGPIDTGAGPRKPNAAPIVNWAFEDVSAKVGLGMDGLAADRRGDTLTVGDVNGDGRPDFLYGAGTGILVLNTPKGFVEAKNSGIAYRPGKIGPVFADFDNSGRMGLFVPQLDGKSKLFQNDGKGRFTDVTAKAGDLAKFDGAATSAVLGDLDSDGNLDLVIGCLRGPNRFFRNNGNGTFTDQTEAIGLHQRIFNTQGVCLVDLNNDGALDLVFNNEGQDSCVLLGNPALASGKQTPVSLAVAGTGGVIGSQVRVLGKDGKTVAAQHISGGDSRGGQVAPIARFALKPGTYRVEVRYSSGVVRGKEIVVAASPMRGVIDDETPKMK